MTHPDTFALTGVRVLDPPHGHYGDQSVDVVIADSLIQDVRPARGRTYGEADIDGKNLLVTPGLVNGHTHSHEAFHRGRYPKLPLEIWMHFLRPPVPIELSSEDVYLRTLLAAIEAIRGGATTVVDDVAVPSLDPDLLDAIKRAYADVGVRAIIAPSAFDLPYFAVAPFVREEMPAPLFRELSKLAQVDSEELLRRLAEIVGRTERKTSIPDFAIAPSAPQRCSPEFLARLGALARQHELPAIIHVQETRLQVVAAFLEYGHSAVAELDNRGFLGPMWSLVHGVWLSEDDISRVSTAGASVQHNPVSNLRLGSGLASVTAMLEAGVNVTLGTDGLSSCITTRMSGVMRQAALLSSLRDTPAWLDRYDVIAMATSNGATALGLGGVTGGISPGMVADLTGYSLDHPTFSPLNDPARQLLYAEDLPPSTVIVGGTVTLRDNELTRLDERAVLARARAAHRRLLPQIEASDRFVAENMVPVYERVHARAAGYELPDGYHARLEGDAS